jgi:SAM-dependent methyltransferase
MTQLRFLFGGAVFLGSFLLFLVEPIAAKQLLPVLGGSAAVWITCLVFFQTALLVAYLYAHWLAQRSHWALHFYCQGRARNIGVIGLGVGTIAAYGQAGDRIRFYEINPTVYPIAQRYFTYLRDSAAQVDSVQGDARTTLAAEPPMGYDVLVIDAFSGDAIPLHLLTAQAMDLYKRHLAPGGILAFHISNQHVDLEPEIVQLARAANLDVRRVTSFENHDRGEFTATWMLLTNNAAFFNQPEVADKVNQPVADPRIPLWTDDYSSLLPLLRW